MANVGLLAATLAQIELHPENWEQSCWATQTVLPKGNVCGTAYCFAGTALVLAGYKPVFYSSDADTGRFIKDGAQNYVYVDDAAAAELGLDDWEAAELFAAGNTLADIREIVADLIKAEVTNG